MSRPVPMPTEQSTVTVDEIWENQWLRAGRSNLYEQVRNGTIPSIRLGRRIVVPTASLRRLLGLAEVAS